MKKAQGLSLNTIIIAIIVLIVLVVLLLVFTGRMGIFSKGVASCTDKGGTCRESSAACNENDEAVYGGSDCPDDMPVCCIPTINLGE